MQDGGMAELASPGLLSVTGAGNGDVVQSTASSIEKRCVASKYAREK